MTKFIIRKLKTIDQIKKEFKPLKNDFSGSLFFKDSGLYILSEMFDFFGREHKFWFAAYREERGKFYNVYWTKEKKWYFDDRWFVMEDFLAENDFKV